MVTLQVNGTVEGNPVLDNKGSSYRHRRGFIDAHAGFAEQLAA